MSIFSYFSARFWPSGNIRNKRPWDGNSLNEKDLQDLADVDYDEMEWVARKYDLTQHAVIDSEGDKFRCIFMATPMPSFNQEEEDDD
jgi:hypothetical protein